MRGSTYFSAKESLWIEYGYGGRITDMEDTVGASKINPLQNGFLLRQHIHSQFNQYLRLVNPGVSASP